MARRVVLLMVWLLVADSPLLAAQDASPPPPSAENVGLARLVLTAMGVERQLGAGVESALPAQRRLQSGIPAVFWDSLLAEMHHRGPEIVDSMAGTYATLFSAAQLRDLLAFYESPTGRRLAEVQPELLATMSAVAQRWGVRMAADVMKRLVDQGVNFESP